MLNEKVEQYIENLIPERSEFFQEMETYAREHHVPIMEIVGVETLLQLLRIYEPSNILEIGAAIGYSSLRMVDALPKCNVVTIERNEERFRKAQDFIGRANQHDRVKLIKGDALEVSEQVKEHGPFDCLFIDAAKGQYLRFFNIYEPMVKKGGIIISDNILFKGLVADDVTELAETQTRRKRALIKKIDHYNEWLMSNEHFQTAILPMGDGIAISIKRGD